LEEPTAESLAAAVRRLAALKIDPAACRHNAERFDRPAFLQRMRDAINTALAQRGPA
jgi:hypothetical protein